MLSRTSRRESVRTGMLSPPAAHSLLPVDRDEAAKAALPAPTEVDAPHGAHHGTQAQSGAHPDAGLNPSADSGRRDGGAGGAGGAGSADRNACPGADGGARAVGRGAGEGDGPGASGVGDGGRGWEGDACSGEEGRGASGRERIGGAKHKSHGGSRRCSRFSMVDEQQVRRGGERACDCVESVTVDVIEWETVIRAHVSRTPCALLLYPYVIRAHVSRTLCALLLYPYVIRAHVSHTLLVHTHSLSLTHMCPIPCLETRL